MSVLLGFLQYLIGFSLTFLVILFSYFKWSYQYFSRRDIPSLTPHIPFGNVSKSLKGQESIGLSLQSIYKEMKNRHWKYGGIFFFTSPNIMILDLAILKSILTKDFEFFPDRNTYYNQKDDPLSAHLFNLTGPKWRKIRSRLTPVFTPSKLRHIVPLLTKCLGNLHGRIEENLHRPVDIKEILTCFAMDVITTSVFGLECPSPGEDSPFELYWRKVTKISKLERLKYSFVTNFPKLSQWLRLTITKLEVTNFFLKFIKDCVNQRQRQDVQRDNILEMLIDIANDDSSFTINDIAAQSFVFFLGGFDTTTTLLSFALFELARNADVQEKLRKEILAFEEISYETIQAMSYLTQVLEETLRMYPPAPLTNRKCQKDYKVPGENLIIEKGTTVRIPILGIHHDPEYYKDPENFDPDRFTDEQKALRNNYTFLPFGEGPRNCIGMRFGLLQSKIALASLLKSYKFSVNSKTKQPLQFKATNVILSVVGEIWLNVVKI